VEEITIREMTESDWPDVSRIYREGIETGLATFERECPAYEKWDAAHLKVCRLVAAADGRVVGWTALSPVSTRCVYAGVAEVSIYIDRRCRGKGIGRRLLCELICRSEENGFWTLQSGIFSENEASVRLHKSCGFRTVGCRERIARDRLGIWRSTLLMERRSACSRFGEETPPPGSESCSE